MASAKVSILTKEDIADAARHFKWTRQMPKWTVVVEGREFPARPLVLEAAGVPPNDPTNSHQAVAILQDRGFDVRYQGEAIHIEGNSRGRQLATDEFIHRLRGSGRGASSLVEAREREHRIEENLSAK